MDDERGHRRCLFTILAPLKTRFLDSGQLMVRILSGIFPTFPPQNLPIFPYFSLFLTPFSSTFFLSFFTLVVFRGARFTNYDLRFQGIRAQSAFQQSEGAAEFLKQGELLAEKRPELRHAGLAALPNHQWFMTFPAYFLHPRETHEETG